MKLVYSLSLFLGILCFSCQQKQVVIQLQDDSERAIFGAERLKSALQEAGYTILDQPTGDAPLILVNRLPEDAPDAPGKEGFVLQHQPDGTLLVAGADATGTLYGCLELADRIKKEGLPDQIQVKDQPEMVMRGTCIGLQKTTYLPGRTVYEYPYTPENFPWFYDKELWIQYLDMLVDNRMNSLYLWSGHPFASLVKLEDYPYALEVDEEIFLKNKEMFAFLTEEANKRGIWVIQMFYNIIVSKPFAEHHGIETQDRSRPIIPFIADYTRKSIAAFIENYPNVGLLVALGEAMNTIEDDVTWFNETVIPGVKDGLAALGRTDEPPIILRAHDTDAKRVIDEAVNHYQNLYTTHKYNGESLTTYEPRGPWSQIHRDLSALGSVHISNVHILANLEPFRFGSPDFIQKSVQAMHSVHGANALHLYPQTSYWDWPYTADNTEPRLLEMERDWIWYEAWARYAWEADRPRSVEIDYWSGKLAEMYGCEGCGENILEAYEQTGEIAPKLLRKFGITEGNRQTLLLGMLMSQLVNPYKWRVYPGFYESVGPEGEILIQYAEKEWKGEAHVGETPVQLIREVREHAAAAVKAIDAASTSVSANVAEFERLKNDVYCYDAFANSFALKVEAALKVLEYQYSEDLQLLEDAVPLLEQSVEEYEKLVDLTRDTYWYANSMQTKQRRIPVGGNDGKNKTWLELLPFYEEELANLKKNIHFIKTSSGAQPAEAVQAWRGAKVKLNPSTKYVLKAGQRPYSDQSNKLLAVADELQQLSGVTTSWTQMVNEGAEVSFTCEDTVKLLVGYFRSERPQYLAPPTLETNAQANNRGQAEVLLVNAVHLEDLPPVNVHAYTFEPGEHRLKLSKGGVVLLGFVSGDQLLLQRDAGLGTDEARSIDWLFY